MDSPGLRDLLGAECHGECLAVDQYNLTMFKESTRIGWHMMGQFTVFVCFYHVWSYWKKPISLYEPISLGQTNTRVSGGLFFPNKPIWWVLSSNLRCLTRSYKSYTSSIIQWWDWIVQNDLLLCVFKVQQKLRMHLDRLWRPLGK
jgi:hypothetical protein